MAVDKINAAKAVYDTVCEALGDREWHFDADPEKMMIRTGVIGDDLPMDIVIDVNVGRQLLLVVSVLPMTVPEDRRVEMAVAISFINNILVDGSFGFDLKSGRIIFRLTSSFIESTIGKDAFQYMLSCSCSMIDEFNDKLMMISHGMLSADDFISSQMQ